MAVPVTWQAIAPLAERVRCQPIAPVVERVRCQPIARVEEGAGIGLAGAVHQRALEEARSTAEMEVPRARVAAEEARAWVVVGSAAAVARAAVVIVAAEAGDKRT